MTSNELTKIMKKEGDDKTFNYKGYSCFIHRHAELKSLCGYIEIPEGHVAFKKEYDDLTNIEVHGGLTYSHNQLSLEACKEGWYLGFDCAHCMDLVPSVFPLFKNTTGVYRTMNYVETQLKKLVDQLEEMEEEK